ncbi:MAG: glycosyltransferase family 39 protein [Chloroflexi bacterium]|nr:glycosyltransferase family 39 protein [Chloroflexota bacterium]
MSKRRAFIWLLGGATAVLIAAILADRLPILRGPAPETSEWYWPYQLRPAARWPVPLLAALGLWGTAVWLQLRPGAKQWGTAVALIGLTLGSILLQLSLIYADRPAVTAELIDRTLSNLASGFFEPAAEIEDLNAVLSAYPEAMPAFASEHARTHPPGLLAANWLTIQAFARMPNLSETIARHVWPARCADLWLLDRPPHIAAALGTWAVLPLLAAAISVWPAYALARRWLPEPTARLATGFIAALPSLLLFAPKSVQLYAPLTLLIFLTLQLGLERRQPFWFFLSGTLFSLSSFLNLGNGALILLMGGYVALSLYRTQINAENAGSEPKIAKNPHKSAKSAFQNSFALALGAVSIWLVYWLGWGVPPWAVLQTGLRQHYELVTLGRRYEWWIIHNLIDLFVFAGLPLIVGFALALATAIRQIRAKSVTDVSLLALSLLPFILLLDLSGSTRGETGRLWLFFMPLLAFAAADALHNRLPGRWAAPALIGLQLGITVSLGLAWKPVRAVIVQTERPSMPATTPQTNANIIFNDPYNPITLAGYDLNWESEKALNLTLYWEAAGAARRPYTVFTHLVNAKGELIAQHDNWPVNGQWPPTCWRPGETIIDSHRLELPAETPTGEYALLVGLYDAQNSVRLPTADGQDATRLNETGNR